MLLFLIDRNRSFAGQSTRAATGATLKSLQILFAQTLFCYNQILTDQGLFVGDVIRTLSGEIEALYVIPRDFRGFNNNLPSMPVGIVDNRLNCQVRVVENLKRIWNTGQFARQ